MYVVCARGFVAEVAAIHNYVYLVEIRARHSQEPTCVPTFGKPSIWALTPFLIDLEHCLLHTWQLVLVGVSIPLAAGHGCLVIIAFGVSRTNIWICFVRSNAMVRVQITSGQPFTICRPPSCQPEKNQVSVFSRLLNCKYRPKTPVPLHGPEFCRHVQSSTYSNDPALKYKYVSPGISRLSAI